LSNVTYLKRQAIFQEDGTICDPRTGEIRELHSTPSRPKPDLTGPQIAAKFIAELFGDNKTEHDVHICRYTNSGGDLPFKKVNTRNPSGIERFVEKYDEAGGALYFACGTIKPGATGRTKSDISEISFLWADIDFKDIVEDRASVERRLATLKYPPSYTVFTGHGIHCYWLLSEAVDAQAEQPRIEEDLRLFRDLVGGDINVCEIARVMRLPGSRNSKFDGEMIPVEILTSNGRRYHIGDIEEMLTETAPILLHKERPVATTAGETDYYTVYGQQGSVKPPIDVKERLDAMMFMGGDVNGIHPTQRSVTASLMKKGEPIDGVVELVLQATKAVVGEYGGRWNWGREEKKIRGMCVTALNKYGPTTSNSSVPASNVVHAQFGAGRTEKLAPPEIEIFWHGKSYERPTRSWLVDELVPQTGQGLASGVWGSGKTFVCIDLAASVITGTPFAGRDVCRQGGVIFIAAEGAGEIPVRLEGVVDHKLRPDGTIKGSDLDNLPFAWIEECPSLKEEASFERLVALVQAAATQMKQRFGVDLVLIAIDTLSAAADFSDANDAAEGQRIMNRLNTLSRRTGAFVLAVDHFGKSTETGTRGSSAKEAAADVVLAILAERGVEGTVSKTRLAVRKLRGGVTGTETPFDLKVVDLGFNQTTCIIEWRAELPATDTKGTGSGNPWKSLGIFRSAVQVALADHGKTLRPFGQEGPQVRAVPISFVRSEFMAAYPAEGETEEQKRDAKRKAFARQLKLSRGRNLICSRDVAGVDQIWLANDG
jgi:AAA domain